MSEAVKFDMEQEFDKYPAGRTKELFGEGSGEVFRTKVLDKFLNDNQHVVIKVPRGGLDASFIDESFVRAYNNHKDNFWQIIDIDVSSDDGKDTKRFIESIIENREKNEKNVVESA